MLDVCLGFDGSDSHDWTVIRAETIDGYQFTPTFGVDRLPTIWNPSDHQGRIPRAEVHAAVDDLFATYRVEYMFCDPPYWDTEIEKWSLRYGEKRVFAWYTNRATQMHEACRRFVTDLSTGALTHDDCPFTAEHMANARKLPRPGDRYVLGKPAQHQKIDAAVTSVLCHEAASDARAAGWGGKQGPDRVSHVMYSFS